MSEGKETVINSYTGQGQSLFTTDRGLAGRMKRAGFKLDKENEGGWWFDLEGCNVVVEKTKERGEGVKREVIN